MSQVRSAGADARAAKRPTTVVFDLGGVLLRWEPHRAFEDVLAPDEVQSFLDEVDFAEWNHRHDAGGRFADGVLELSQRFPHHAEAIAAYPRNHHLTITGQMDETVAIVDELAERGVRLLALTNWSAETFPWARRTFPVLQRFEAIVVSGEEGVAKPDLRLYRILLDRYDVTASEAVFVDDRQINIDAARQVDMFGVLFTDAAALHDELRSLGLLG